MKIQWNKRYTTMMLYAMIVVLCVIVAAFIISDLRNVWMSIRSFLSKFSPIFYGALIAYLLAPILNFMERRVVRIKRYGWRRAIAIVLTYLLTLAFLALFFWRIVPPVLRGYDELQSMASWYLEAVSAWLLDLSVVDGMLSGYISTVTEYAVELLTEIYSALAIVIPDVGAIVGAVASVVTDVLLGVMLSVYYLASKEKLLAQMKKLGHALMRKKRYRHFATTLNLANKNFGGYIKAQIADALILGCAHYICAMIIGIPYYPLVSVLIGIFAIIPVIGPLVGPVAGALIVLLADPLAMLWFILLMTCLVFLNGRLIKPRIIRTGVETSSIFMFTALLITTGLVGFWGLILGVPIFTILYALLHSFVDHQLLKKGYVPEMYFYYSTTTGRELYKEAGKRKDRQASGKLFGPPPKRNDELFTTEFSAMPDSAEFLAMQNSTEMLSMNTSDFKAMSNNTEIPTMKTTDFEVYSETIATEDRVITSEIPIPEELRDDNTNKK